VGYGRVVRICWVDDGDGDGDGDGVGASCGLCLPRLALHRDPARINAAFLLLLQLHQCCVERSGDAARLVYLPHGLWNLGRAQRRDHCSSRLPQ
jgi:hypothetical protein